MKRRIDFYEARFEEIIRKEVVNYDNLMELEDMPFVDSVQPLGDRIIVEKEGKQFILKMEEGYLKWDQVIVKNL